MKLIDGLKACIYDENKTKQQKKKENKEEGKVTERKERGKVKNKDYETSTGKSIIK